MLDPAPAKIEPALGGSWKWQTTNALRFQPSGGLPVASEYKVSLEPSKIVGYSTKPAQKTQDDRATPDLSGRSAVLSEKTSAPAE